ncbi:MAG: competence/damage-inducible protein A [Acidimicrobiales bacterium]
MRCEIVAVGTELLLGQIVDTNSAWLGEQLALSGIDHYFSTTVGDNLDRITSVLEIALDRSDAVIVCGGLGPTQDDITRDAIAAVMGVELVLDDDVAARIEAMFAARGRRMPVSNFRQAEIPDGATVIRDPFPGTAPGLICPVGEKVLYAVPGVPHELDAIVSAAVLPDLRRRAGATAVIRSRTLRTWGESESGLAERLAGRVAALDGAGNPTLAFLASGIEGLKVRITAKAPDEVSAQAMLAAEEAAVRLVLGDLVFGCDNETIEHAVAVLVQDQGLSLGLAESLTGGLMGARICDVPGASAFFRGSIVSYASDVKHKLLGVPEGPVVSAPAAEAMAVGACRVLRADVGLAVTGVAGPTEQDGQPVGTVFIGLSMDGSVASTRLQLPGDRRRIRDFTSISAFNWLRLRLLDRVRARAESGADAAAESEAR